MSKKKKLKDITEDDVQWVVNDYGELGVRIAGRHFFLYKGRSLNYKADAEEGQMVRLVGKREFGECCISPLHQTKGDGRFTVGCVDLPNGGWEPLIDRED